jgi:hemerythrin
MIEWTPKLEVGHPMVDQDHYRLVMDINSLIGDISHCANDSRVRAAMDRLTRHTKAHFAGEERLMGALSYSEAAVHKGAHRHLIRRIESLRHDLGSGRRVADGQTIWLLENWLVDHILTCDKKLSGFLLSSHGALRREGTSEIRIRHRLAA